VQNFQRAAPSDQPRQSCNRSAARHQPRAECEAQSRKDFDDPLPDSQIAAWEGDDES
jgi:hypothetical protein